MSFIGVWFGNTSKLSRESGRNTSQHRHPPGPVQGRRSFFLCYPFNTIDETSVWISLVT